MPQPEGTPRDENDDDIARVSQDIAGRLHALGVETRDDESPEAIVRILEAVEKFEQAVVAQGGDLMMDEPPANQAGQPDDPHFLLPSRAADESADGYARRLAEATAAVQRHRPLR